MRRWTFALMCVLPVLGSGCSYAQNMRRNLVTAPHYAFANIASQHRSTQMGREAYLQMASRYSDHEFSCDYRKGFVDGFADYLDYGGVGEPPPIPPASYRFFGYMTPGGLAAMEDWTIGFRHGAATAKASGLRELVVLPVYWGPNYNPSISNAGPSPPTSQRIDSTPGPLTPAIKQDATSPEAAIPSTAPVSPAPPKPIEGPPPAPAPIVPPVPPGVLKPMAYQTPAVASPPANHPGNKPSVPPPSSKLTTEPANHPGNKPSVPPQPSAKKPGKKQRVNPGEKPSVPPPPANELPPERY